jgi:hypothetical protein
MEQGSLMGSAVKHGHEISLEDPELITREMAAWFNTEP